MTLTNDDLAAIWNRDIDPGASTQQAYGALWTILVRSGTLNNVLVPALQADVDEIKTTLTTVQADLAYIKNILDQFTTDYAAEEPNLLYDTVVDAIEATH